MNSYRVHVVEGIFTQDEAVCLPDSDVIAPAARRLRDWWWRSASKGIPIKRTFDILDHAGAARDLFLLEILPDGTFRNRIVGERAKAHVEPGRAGSIIRPDDSRDFIQVLHRHYNLVVAERRPVLCTSKVHYADMNPMLFEGLDCPLSLDGANVSHIIGVLSMITDLTQSRQEDDPRTEGGSGDGQGMSPAQHRPDLTE